MGPEELEAALRRYDVKSGLTESTAVGALSDLGGPGVVPGDDANPLLAKSRAPDVILIVKNQRFELGGKPGDQVILDLVGPPHRPIIVGFHVEDAFQVRPHLLGVTVGAHLCLTVGFSELGPTTAASPTSIDHSAAKPPP